MDLIGRISQQTQNICIKFVQRRHNVLHNICTTSAQRLRRWSNIVQMLDKCFVFTGMPMLVLTPHNPVITTIGMIAFFF